MLQNFLFASLCFFAAAPTAASAQSEPSQNEPAQQSEQHAEAQLFARAEGETVRVVVEVKVDEGWHVYHGPDQDDVGSQMGLPTRPVLEGEGFTWGDWRFPEPDVEELDFGDVVRLQVHHGTIAIQRVGTKTAEARLEDLELAISGQTCTSGPMGTCLPFGEKVAFGGAGPDALFAAFPADLSATPSVKPAAANATDAQPDAAQEPDDPEAAEGSGAIEEEPIEEGAIEEGEVEAGRETSLLAFLISAVFWGVFTLLMPCTYPMIPITISYFTKQADARRTGTLPLSLAYGAGIVLIFILIGLLAAPLIIPFAAHPITNLVIGAFFLLFALVLFGVMDLRPPAFLLRVAGSASQKGGYVGVFLMGATLVVTSFTCTAPFVGTLLSTAATSGGVGRIALGMGVFGLTMAVPFVFLSMVPAKVKAMPKSGEWMHTLKVYLGFVEVAAALKFISNADLVWGWGILSRELFLFLWFALFALAAAYLLGMFRLKDEYGQEDSAAISPKRMVYGIATSLLAVYCLLGGLGHSMDPIMTALAPPYSSKMGGSASNAGADSATNAGPITIKDDFEAAFARAKAERKLLLVNFTGIT